MIDASLANGQQKGQADKTVLSPTGNEANPTVSKKTQGTVITLTKRRYVILDPEDDDDNDNANAAPRQPAPPVGAVRPPVTASPAPERNPIASIVPLPQQQPPSFIKTGLPPPRVPLVPQPAPLNEVGQVPLAAQDDDENDTFNKADAPGEVVHQVVYNASEDLQIINFYRSPNWSAKKEEFAIGLERNYESIRKRYKTYLQFLRPEELEFIGQTIKENPNLYYIHFETIPEIGPDGQQSSRKGKKKFKGVSKNEPIVPKVRTVRPGGYGRRERSDRRAKRPRPKKRPVREAPEHRVTRSQSSRSNRRKLGVRRRMEQMIRLPPPVPEGQGHKKSQPGKIVVAKEDLLDTTMTSSSLRHGATVTTTNGQMSDMPKFPLFDCKTPLSRDGLVAHRYPKSTTTRKKDKLVTKLSGDALDDLIPEDFLGPNVALGDVQVSQKVLEETKRYGNLLSGEKTQVAIEYDGNLFEFKIIEKVDEAERMKDSNKMSQREMDEIVLQDLSKVLGQDVAKVKVLLEGVSGDIVALKEYIAGNTTLIWSALEDDMLVHALKDEVLMGKIVGVKGQVNAEKRLKYLRESKKL